MEWFRFYNETLWDRKLRRLPPAQRWVWLAILAIANDSHERGRLLIGTTPATAEDVRDAAAVDPADFEEAWNYYQRQEMLATAEDGVLFVVNWHKRQFASDDAGGRKKAWQDRKKEGENGAETPPNGTFSERSSDVPQNGRRTGQKAEGRKQRADTDANAYALAGQPAAHANNGASPGDAAPAASLPAGQKGEEDFPISLAAWRAIPRGDLFPLVRAAFPAWNGFWDHKLGAAAESNGGKPVTSPGRYLDSAIREHLPDMLAGNMPPAIHAPSGSNGQNGESSSSDGRNGGRGGGRRPGSAGTSARSGAGRGDVRSGAAGVDGAAATGDGTQPGRPRRSKYPQVGEVGAGQLREAAGRATGSAEPAAAGLSGSGIGA